MPSVLVTDKQLQILVLNQGTGGTAVTITGTGFNTTLSNNVVYLNKIKCAVTAATSTSLTVTIPYGGITGKFMYTNTGTTKVCQSGQIFVMSYSGFPLVNSYECNSSALASTYNQNFPVWGYEANQMGPYTIFDVDQDNKPDIIYTNGYQRMYNSNGQFWYETTLRSLKNNSLNTDLVVSSSSFSSTNTLASYNSYAIEASNFPGNMYIGDFNGSGFLDFMFGVNGQSENNRLIRNLGSNTHASSNFSVINPKAGLQTTNDTHGALLDINRNGTLDFIGHYLSTPWAVNDNFTLSSNTSSGTSLAFASTPNWQDFTASDKIAWGVVETLDFDNDGDDDVLLVSRSGPSDSTYSNARLYMLKNNGSNTFFNK